jgi:hypothetical protein
MSPDMEPLSGGIIWILCGLGSWIVWYLIGVHQTRVWFDTDLLAKWILVLALCLVGGVMALVGMLVYALQVVTNEGD